jgi:hypothetical protein
LKILVAVLMSALVLGAWAPQPVCAGATSSVATKCSCCGTDCPMSHGEPDKSCGSSCTPAPVQAFDKQLPARMMVGAAPCGGPLLFLIAPVKITYPTFVSVVRPREPNVSPPFGGRPPQAVLRLWLI